MENTKKTTIPTYCILLYATLYALPFPFFSFLLWGGSYETQFNQLWFDLAHLINALPYAEGKNAAEINLTGDTSYHYFKCLVLLGTAIILGLVFYRSKFKKVFCEKAHLLLRLFIGSTLISYGMAKILPAQFDPISLLRLYQPLGEMSPMTLL